MTDKTEQSIPSRGSQPVAWAVVNPSGGTRFLGLTQEDAQRVATGSERVRPVYWPVLTDAEWGEIEGIVSDFQEIAEFNEERCHPHYAEKARRRAAMLIGLLERLGG